MNVLLIKPDCSPDSPTFNVISQPPMGLMYIASMLENKGYNIKIIDVMLLRLNETELSIKILKINPDIVGIKVDSINFIEGIRVAHLVKTISNALVVMGGPHATIRAKEVIQYPEVDVVVIGEGEYTMLEIVERIEKGSTLEGCKGTIIKQDGIIIENPIRLRINDLNVLPFPARHLVPYNKYPKSYIYGQSTLIKHSVDYVNTSRGCPYNCSFCSSRLIWGKKYVTRNAKSVVDEVEFLINNYGAKVICFREDIFTGNMKRVSEICREIKKRKIDIDWICSSRVDCVNKRLLSEMYDAGCKAISYGMESGSQKTLNKLNKRITVSDIRNVVKLTKDVGIAVGGSFIIGVFGETINDINLTINLTKELKLNHTVIYPFLAIPDSKIYYKVKNQGAYDSAFGGMLYVRTHEFNRAKLNLIIENLYKYLAVSNQINNLKRNFLRYFVKYGLTVIRHPKKIKIFIKNLKKRN